MDAFEQLGNPFLEDSGELLDLDQLIFMPPDVVDNVRKVNDIGFQLYTTFLNKRVSSQEEAFNATLHEANLKNSKWVWSGNTTITNCRQTHDTVRKSHITITTHQEDKLKLFKASLSEPRRKFRGISHQKPTSKNYLDLVGSQFWSHHQWLCILLRQLHPSSLAYL